MKIRSTEELIDFLGGAIHFRKREMINIKSQLCNRERSVNSICRIAVVFAYAHWEGFIKEAAQAYICYVSSQRKTLSSLTKNFQAICCRRCILNVSSAANKIHHHIDLVETILDNGNKYYSLDYINAIQTNSNLNAEVFHNICMTVGIPSVSDTCSNRFIDELVKNRCCIAHGNNYDPDYGYAMKAIDFVLEAIDKFKTDIENAAVLKTYLR
ncbi:MAE_28990/MAE_18760 family HEPN-like nuclease [Desulfolutivibrio sulfoxidireducens]|uniref:MAE_28990/MAE_18760 family HEPN-like nuclease n=1 Tax=Desulfolutivibrio sulfoxidireducens TaxID=2773299 RepID=UPI00159E9DF1|nr:MAE_28990/MAE_18760 family HEPN-like nuclease [Desulfolutivibrio sulfoxidireducens]QLA17594.1 hypothetical protein GD605_16660 [Desulfolutivibrio sulfoxidireducens]